MGWINICSTGEERIFTGQPNFFVTGLPRSRTAWFSEYLPNCLHEGMVGCYTHEDYLGKLVNGDSSSLLVFFPLRRYFPDSPLVIVERDVDDIIESLKNIKIFNNASIPILKTMQKRLAGMDGLRVAFNNLDFEEIWDYLIGEGFDENRAKEFNMKNIQKVNRNPDRQALKHFLGEP
jgi:hypothetical protein